MSVPRFHLREGFYFARESDQVVIAHGETTLYVPVDEWASAVAATSLRGDTRETWDEARRLLDASDLTNTPRT